jgi:membrane protease YdiL (CAAX protease family)
MAAIFALGILLGTARVKTGSIVVSIALHMISNIISTVEMIAQSAN